MTAYNVVSPSALVAGQPEDVSVILANFQAIAAVLNGNLDNANIATAAAIAASKLAGYPADATKVLKGDGSWGPAAVPAVIPARLDVPSAGAFWQATALGAIGWQGGHYELPDAVSSSVFGSVLVPQGVTTANLRFVLAANVTTGAVRVSGYVASAQDGQTLAPATWDILNASLQTVAMPGTAWFRKDVIFALTGLLGGDLLPIALTRIGADGADTMTANLGLFGAWLEPA